MMETVGNLKQQQGAALLVALSFLVVITLISLSAMRSSTTELRLASNNEEQMAALQVAQAAVDSALSNPDNFVVTGDEGSVNTNITISGVTEFTHATMSLTEGATTLPPRGLGVSADKFQATMFDVDASYDNVAGGRGQAGIGQGMVLLIPKT